MLLNGDRFSVVIWDWPVKGSKRIKPFNNLVSAEEYIRDFISMYADASDQIMLLHGEILKMGGYSHNND